MVKLSEQFHHRDTKTRSERSRASESVRSWKSVDSFSGPVASPLFSSAAPVVNLTDHGSMITDQQFGSSDGLFIDHCSLVIERSADADGQVTLYVYDNNPLAPATNRVNLGRLYGKYYFATSADYQAYIANPAGATQPNETIIYAYYTAADVSGGVTGAFVGEVKSITDNLITPANGDPRSAYTNVTTFQYDSNGNLTQESGPSGTINYVYDLATQRHTETWTGTSYASAVSDIKYGYHSMGEHASVTVLKENGQTPAAVASSTQYNATGGTSTTNLPNTVYTYDPGSRLETTLDSATGTRTTYTYKPNTNYISTETVTRNLSPVTLAVYSYTYRADGLKTGATETTLLPSGATDTAMLTWTYDALDRLMQEVSTDSGNTARNYTNNYSYDLNSNRISETTDANGVNDTITSTYNADNELTQSVDANTGTTVYTYDPNGSQTSVTHTPNGTTSPDTTTTNEYDMQGQLDGTQTTNSSGTTKATYEYDDAGNRVVENNTNTAGTTTTTYYLVDTQNPNGYPQPIEQGTTPGSPQITYVWGAQLISETYATGATIPGVGTATRPTTYYILTDAHGNTRVVTNATGTVVETMNYDAFGNALGFNASVALTTYLYSSMPFDAASGNYYDHARYFDTGTGTFTQADYGYTGSLADPMTDLPYTFTGGDPINMLDLNGHGFTLAGTLSAISDLSLEIATQIRVYPEALVAATRLLAVVNLISFISDPQAYEQSFISTGGNPAEGFATLLDDMNSVGRDALVEWAQAEGVAQTDLALVLQRYLFLRLFRFRDVTAARFRHWW